MPYSHWHILGCEVDFQCLAIMAGIRTQGQPCFPAHSGVRPHHREELQWLWLQWGSQCHQMMRHSGEAGAEVLKLTPRAGEAPWGWNFKTCPETTDCVTLGSLEGKSKSVFTPCSVGNLLPEATDGWATPPMFLVQDIWGHLYLDQVTRWCWCNWSRHHTLRTDLGKRRWNVFCSKEKPAAAQTQRASFLLGLTLFLIRFLFPWRVLGHSFMEGTHFCPLGWHSVWVRGRICSLSSMRSSKFCSHGCL